MSIMNSPWLDLIRKPSYMALFISHLEFNFKKKFWLIFRSGINCANCPSVECTKSAEVMITWINWKFEKIMPSSTLQLVKEPKAYQHINQVSMRFWFTINCYTLRKNLFFPESNYDSCGNSQIFLKTFKLSWFFVLEITRR